MKALLQDPRTSFAEIAKNCGMSTNAIRMRFKRLTTEGIINGAIMQVNPKSLGYNCIALLGIKADANEETSVYDFVENLPEIIQSFQPIGKYSVLSFAALKSVDALAHTLEQINSHQCVSEVEECIWVDVVRMDHPENLIIEPFNDLSHTTKLLSKNDNPKTTIMPSHAATVVEEKYLDESHELDEIDIGLINMLSENASMSFRKVARQLGISTQAVIRRYNRLKKGVLPYSSITLNLKKLGYDGNAIFFIKTLHPHTVSKVFDGIVRIPNVIVACKCLGVSDIFVAVPFSNFEQLLIIKQEIAKTPGVKQMEVYIDKPFLRWPLNLFTHFFRDKSKLLKNI
jgi:DNA-binding Lrp family transcriptional regulator